jgi:uncharacterized protein YggE
MRRATTTTYAAMILLAILLSSSVMSQEIPPPAPPPRAQPRGPAVTVTGGSDVSIAPDRAIVRLGSVARGDAAASAQDSVNTAVQRVLDAVRHLDVADKNIATSGVTLSPIYTNQGQDREPRISGFEARNTITITLDDVSRVGPVLDAAIKAGANEVQGVSFELKDQTEPRSRALRQAVQNARTKAEAIAAGLGMRITGVLEATESDVPPPRPMMLGRAVAMETAPAPIQPGQVQVHGAVTIVYSLAPGDKPMP